MLISTSCSGMATLQGGKKITAKIKAKRKARRKAKRRARG
jgi:hypothetical protein